MTFAWPLLLWLLLLPAAWCAWDYFHRRSTVTTAQPNILRAEAGRSSLVLSREAGTMRRSRPRLWFVAGISLGIVALARPQWGRLDEPVFEQAREILIATDLSRSMLTPDVKPSRLDRSKLLIQSLLDRLQGERVGLLVFSGTALLQSPLSADYEVLREFLPSMGPDFLPEGGTNYSQLITTSIQAFSESNASDRFLIILSDGEATDDDWKARIPDLKRKNIRVIGLGVGTTEGGMIPDGTGNFLKDDAGAVVKSHLESSTLKALAEATGGVYRNASEWVDLASLIHETVDTGRKGKFTEENSVRLAERFQWALAPAFILLLISFWKEFPIRPRARTIDLKTATSDLPRAAALLALLFLGLSGAVRAADAPAAAPSQAEVLGKIVARLAAQETRSALDWSEFAQQTLAWGRQIQSTKQPVPENPVKDALSAVNLGRQENPKAADWDKVSSDLNELLKKSEQQPQKQPPKDDKKDQKDQKNDQQKNDSKQDKSQKQDSKQDKQDQKNQANQDEQKKDGNQQPSSQNDKEGAQQPPKDDQSKQNNQSAFGDLSKERSKAPPPPPSGTTKQVGGVHDDQPYDPAKADPALASSLQKLEQVKTDDSPAKLNALMRRGEPTPAPDKKGKNW